MTLLTVSNGRYNFDLAVRKRYAGIKRRHQKIGCESNKEPETFWINNFYASDSV